MNLKVLAIVAPGLFILPSSAQLSPPLVMLPLERLFQHNYLSYKVRLSRIMAFLSDIYMVLEYFQHEAEVGRAFHLVFRYCILVVRLYVSTSHPSQDKSYLLIEK
jgi:hypothetical protein